MKTLLFYPPMTFRGDNTTQPGIVALLGLSNIAAHIEREGCDVKICDALAEGYKNLKRGENYSRVDLNQKELAEKIKYHKPNIVGVNVIFTAFSSDVHALAKIVRKTLELKLISVSKNEEK